MSHRGRLNVLANVLQKSYKRIFNEFAGEFGNTSDEGAGDVKYHLGASSNREFDGNSVHVSLTDNPSHLEAVNPVVLGQTRAKQFFHKDKERYFNMQYQTSKLYIFPFVASCMDFSRSLDVLELGCAEAGVLKAFIEEGHNCTGIELSEKRIAETK